jgi:hypothetical protein
MCLFSDMCKAMDSFSQAILEFKQPIVFHVKLFSKEIQEGMNLM